jgi:hypothetical protein
VAPSIGCAPTGILLTFSRARVNQHEVLQGGMSLLEVVYKLRGFLLLHSGQALFINIGGNWEDWNRGVHKVVDGLIKNDVRSKLVLFGFGTGGCMCLSNRGHHALTQCSNLESSSSRLVILNTTK